MSFKGLLGGGLITPSGTCEYVQQIPHFFVFSPIFMCVHLGLLLFIVLNRKCYKIEKCKNEQMKLTHLILLRVYDSLVSMKIINVVHGAASLAFITTNSIALKPLRRWEVVPALWTLNMARDYVSLKQMIAHSSIESSSWLGIKKGMSLANRFIQLSLIFFPSIIALPICVIPCLRRAWMRIFAWSIEQAGVVWIKLFQYLSHRGDVIGDELADMFVYLREFCPEHSFEETNKIFKKVHGKGVHQCFSYFNNKPFASGSVSQVYDAILEGKKVAVKVRHPDIGKNMQLDVSLVFIISNFLSKFSKLFQIPINDESLKLMLREQLDFKKEAQNLLKFNKIFKNPDVLFPLPSPQTTEQILIMSYIEGKPMTYFEKNKNPMNKFIARVGANAFFQMLIQHNFVHADCHGGNIMVSITSIPHTPWTYLKYYWRMFKNTIWNKSIKIMLKSETLRNFCDQQNEDDLRLRQEMLEVGKEVKVTLLDVGMTIELEKAKREYFISFLSEVIQGNPKRCAEMIHRISKYSGNLLQIDEYKEYRRDLEEMFGLIKKVELKNLQGLDVLSGMLSVIRKHRMKLDGEFATLLTNMLVLEGIAKSLDPEINILRCAVSYLPYK